MRISKIHLLGIAAIGAFCFASSSWVTIHAGAQATQADKAEIPPRPAPPCCGYTYPREYDAEIADGDVHRVLFEDGRIMLLEVSNPPGLNVRMHGHPFASVFAMDSSIGPKATGPQPSWASGDAHLDANSSYNDMGLGIAPPPAGAKWPVCEDSSPQAPHRPYNSNVYPYHFYRLEFLRLDGTEIQTHWKEWYPELTQPAKSAKRPAPTGAKFSEQWPYPIAYDPIQAAPENYKLLFEDGKVRLLEVMIRPGETTPMHGTPYSAVIAFNSISGNPSEVTDTPLDPASPLNGQGAGRGGPPHNHNLTVPLCMTTAARAPHSIHNGGAVPLHYYEIEYERIDGDAFADNWRKWYPWMQYMQFMRQ